MRAKSKTYKCESREGSDPRSRLTSSAKSAGPGAESTILLNQVNRAKRLVSLESFPVQPGQSSKVPAINIMFDEFCQFDGYSKRPVEVTHGPGRAFTRHALAQPKDAESWPTAFRKVHR
jgi:hypothetical protein